jgi:TonB family protein
LTDIRWFVHSGCVRGLCAVVVLITPVFLAAQDFSRAGPGITPPRLLHSKEPEYSPDARAEHIQGTVVLKLVVSDQGRPTKIEVLSPLGYGLDEQAEAAVKTWEFAPGMKDGKPVNVLATVQVNFRFPSIWFDEKAERERTSYNVARENLRNPKSTPSTVDKAVKTMQDLAKQKFPPAMYAVGLWEMDGEHLAKDAEDGLALVQKSAARNFGPALYIVALRRIEGQDQPQDVEKGLVEMGRASGQGSAQAQFYLGNRYEKGDGVRLDLGQARRFFRLCAADGVATCQYRLGGLLINEPNRTEDDYVQSVALFQLAAEQGLPQAKDLASKETAKLTAAQSEWVATLKRELVRK